MRSGSRSRGASTTGPFFALNGDVLMDAALDELMAFHITRGARATVTLTEVPDPTRYGLVLSDDEGKVEAFVEKPEPGAAVTLLPPYWINAGAYVLDHWFLDAGALHAARQHRARGVSRCSSRNGLYAWRSTGYWNDIGTPASYLAREHARARAAPPCLGDGAVDRRGATSTRSVVHEDAGSAPGPSCRLRDRPRCPHRRPRAHLGGRSWPRGWRSPTTARVVGERVFLEVPDGA